MASTRIDREIIFSVFCPAIERKAVLYKQTWEQHVLPARPGLKQCLPLIKSVIENPPADVKIFQKIDDPERISFQKDCPNFLPFNKYLRVALRLSGNPDLAIVTTIVPVNTLPTTGVKKYERK